MRRSWITQSLSRQSYELAEMNSWTTALLRINLPLRSFCRGLCVPAEIQGREVWWHPQVEAAPSELGRLSPQDHKSRRRRVSHCCWGNAAPDESNRTYHFVPHLTTPTHWHSHTKVWRRCASPCHKHVEGMHRIVCGIHLCPPRFNVCFFASGFCSSHDDDATGCKSRFLSSLSPLCSCLPACGKKKTPLPFLFSPSLYTYYPLHYKLFRPPGAHPSPYHRKHWNSAKDHYYSLTNSQNRWVITAPWLVFSPDLKWKLGTFVLVTVWNVLRSEIHNRFIRGNGISYLLFPMSTLLMDCCGI